ncbi:hypothetical protein HH308_01185 [Gordonia sp. TBRC 11910]|uniref:Uncharacterized protein n=1 Tax=Gordonia asplenii TaxID=2725283 RepID=A0A848KPA4_9ACTN|nr:hypothetical protein [Gordonia asplenii]NMN99828.1 hypothetical protein [Gordonia asplenii]
MTSAPNRRTVLAAGLVSVGGLTVAPLLAACDSGPTADQLLAQQLQPVARAALDDATTARLLVTTSPNFAAALGVVATERDVHSKALREEITRLDPQAAQTLSSTSTSPSATPASTPTLDALRTQLERSARQAADVGVTMDGYRAGLLASVSASTTTLRKVQLG